MDAGLVEYANSLYWLFLPTEIVAELGLLTATKTKTETLYAHTCTPAHLHTYTHTHRQTHMHEKYVNNFERLSANILHTNKSKGL